MRYDGWFYICRYGICAVSYTHLDVYKRQMHILRHTFATRCIEAGMKPKTLQMLLGHSNIGITMNLYVHTTEEEKKKEMDLVAEALMAM